MLNVAVVDDEAEERARMRECLDFVAEQQKVEIFVDEYSSADGFLVKYQPKYDIVFMDIEFSAGLDGMAAARALRKMDQTVVLIFVTNMAQLAIHGYEVEALDFIVKPLDKYTFLLKMTRALGRVVQRNRECIIVRAEGETVSLRTHLIRYLEVDGHYVIYHSREGTFSEYISLSAAEKKLDDPAFYRCDRGCLVNMRFITQIGRDTCTVDGEKLAIARKQRSQFLRAYAGFLNG